jgi:hypothetical protein
VHNPGTCTVNSNWKTQLQQHIPGQGGFMGVQITYGNSNFPPGDTVVSGNFCYSAPANVNSIRVEFTIDQPSCGNHNPHQKSTSIPPCQPTGGCPLAFGDVPKASPYFNAVNFLNSARVVSGYADGTFRPYSNVTRAQVAKIVVLAFGLPLLAPAGQRFSDVAANNEFASYIETAYANGLVSGYADGTYRPTNNVTRGQLAKIVVQAAKLNLDNPTTPSFSDVSVGSTFYRYIETAHSHGLLSGYLDGTFRAGLEANRGQVCKVTMNAAFPPEE